MPLFRQFFEGGNIVRGLGEVVQDRQGSWPTIFLGVLLVSYIGARHAFSVLPSMENNFAGWRLAEGIVIEKKRLLAGHIDGDPVGATPRIQAAIQIEDPAEARLEIRNFWELDAWHDCLEAGNVEAPPSLKVRVGRLPVGVEDCPFAGKRAFGRAKNLYALLSGIIDPPCPCPPGIRRPPCPSIFIIACIRPPA